MEQPGGATQPQDDEDSDGAALSEGRLGARAQGILLRGQLDALSLFLLALLLLVVVGGVTQRFRAGPLGMALTELLAILLPAVLWSRISPGLPAGGVLHTLRLVPGSPRRGLTLLGGGVLWGGALFLVLAVWIEPLFEVFTPVPPEERAALLALLRPPSGLRPLLLDLLCFALVPAACEEILFRGAILTALRGYARPVPALPRSGPHRGEITTRALSVLLCALLFGAFHRSLAKLLPTSALGLGFGVAAVYSGSLWPAIAMHATNNALVVLLVRRGLEDPPFGPFSLPGMLSLVVTTGLGLLGARLLRRAPDEALRR